MARDLINGIYRILGSLPDAGRPGLHVAHSLVTGELVIVALPGTGGSRPRVPDLRHEGEVFGDLSSPYVHKIVDWNREEVFLAWEYLTAWPLETFVATGEQMTVGRLLRLFLDAAAGIGAVHSAGAVYRGLHPGKILVSRDGSARLATTPAAAPTVRGRSVDIGPPPDTPIQYLSPEQIEGTVDARSDIYTLAAIGYELLTGQPMYSTDDPVTLAVQILKTSPPPPSRHRGDLSPDIDDLFVHCLSRDPDARPGTTAAFTAHVRKLIESEADFVSEPLGASITSKPMIFPLPTARAVEAPPAPPAKSDEMTEPPQSWPAAPPAAHTRDQPLDGPLESREVAVSAPPGEATPLVLLASTGQAFELNGDTGRVGRPDANGRAPEVNLDELDHQRVVSRDHAAFERSEDGWRLRDLGGANGTWVNGRRLKEGESIPVAPGDRLRFANVELVVRAPGEV